MDAAAVVCPHCGYDFPATAPVQQEPTGFAYSPLANVALIVGQVIAAIGCCTAVIGSAVALFNGDLLRAFLVGPLSALFMLAILVVFVRTLDAK